MLTKTNQYRLSQRAQDLLRLIDERTERDDCGQLTRYFVPGADTYYPDWSKDPIRIWGSGDARILRALAAKGLTEKPRGCPHEFGYAITEDGRLVVEEIVMSC